MTVVAVANQPWPTDLVEPFTRDPGGISLLPLAVWWFVVLGWVATTDRLSADAVTWRQPAGRWGMILAFPFLAAAIFAWWIPWFAVGLPLMLVAWWAPMVAYSRVRNPSAPPANAILTIGHARRILADALGRVGITLPGSEPEVERLLPAVTLAADPAASADDQARRQQAASAVPGFADAVALVAEAVSVGASAVRIDLVGAESPVRQEIDGVWHPAKAWGWKKEGWKKVERCEAAPPMPREKATGIRDGLLSVSGIDPRAVRARSAGRFAAKIDGKPWLGHVVTQRAASGEVFAVRIEPQAMPFKSIEDLGIGGPVAEQLLGLLKLEKGLVVVTAPPASGGSTTFDRVVNAADRLVRNFIVVEDAGDPGREIQNVKPFRFDARKGVTPLQSLQLALREYPQVLVTDDLKDPELAVELVSRAESENLVIVGMHAADAIDGVGRLLALGIEPQKLADTLLGVLSQRLVRRLCPKCRLEEPTPPDMLVKLKQTAEQMPSIKVASKEGCKLCNTTGYRGRTGIFELAAGQTLRKAIEKKADRELMIKAAMKDGMRPLAEAGMRLLVEGVTSLEELRRVLKNPAKR